LVNHEFYFGNVYKMLKLFPVRPKTKKELHTRKEYEAKYACYLASCDIKNKKKLEKCIEKCQNVFINPDEESY